MCLPQLHQVCLPQLTDPVTAPTVSGSGVRDQGCALVSQRPDTPGTVRKQAHSLEVGASPGEPVANLGGRPILVEHRLLSITEAQALDDRLRNLAYRR